MDQKTVSAVLYALMFVGVGLFFTSLLKYMRDYKVLSLLKSKLTGDVYEYDRVRRAQMKEAFSEKKGVLSTSGEKKKIPLLSKAYKRIEMTGITTKFPGFSEALFMLSFAVVGITLFALACVFSTPLVALAIFAVYFVGGWYALGLVVYRRKCSVEGQLLQFSNACASASRQYSSVVDIIGAVYDQFDGPFREALEEAYVEAKLTNDSRVALSHLKDKFDSTQLAFVVDNLEMCSSVTGDYYTVATDLSKTVSIFSASHEKKKVTLRNAKVNISVMFVIAWVIVYALGAFFENGLSTIIGTSIGQLLLVLMFAVYLFGMTIKTE